MVKANHALSNSAQAYKSLVRPKLEYGCTVYDPYRANQKSWLEQVQRRAARFVTRTYTTEEGCVTKPLLISPAMYIISLP